MFLHRHPYPPFIPDDATRLIVGTIPPPRFSTGKLFDEDVDFCYGSKFGLLWRILDEIFELDLVYENTKEAIDQRTIFLKKHKIGICDMVDQCKRLKIDASDQGMLDIKPRNIIRHLQINKKVSSILFMGGNSKNGPEYLFRKHAVSAGIPVTNVSSGRPKIHEFMIERRKITSISLISPSSAANRSIGADPYYKSRKSKKPDYTTLDFRIEQYRLFFS